MQIIITTATLLWCKRNKILDLMLLENTLCLYDECFECRMHTANSKTWPLTHKENQLLLQGWF